MFLSGLFCSIECNADKWAIHICHGEFMKILVHYGHGKTGTTSLQVALASKRKLLMQHGVLYPKTFRPVEAHHLLQGLFKSEKNIPPYLVHEYGGYDNLVAKAKQAWENLKREVVRKKPKVLLLSSEMFFGEDPGGEQTKFYQLLSELSDDIQPIIYIRDPADLYLSRRQQDSRASGVVSPPSAVSIRQDIERLELVFGRRLKIRAFQRHSLIGGDIVEDFVTSFLSEYLDPTLVPSVRVNESISAEAMVIASSFRRVVLPNDDRIPFPKSWRILMEIERCEAGFPSVNKPVLRDALAEQIRKSSSDYIWLKENYNITFDTLNYEEIDGAVVPYKDGYKNISGIIEVDWERHDQIIYSILSREMDPVAESVIVVGKYSLKISNISKNLRRLKKRIFQLFGS